MLGLRCKSEMAIQTLVMKFSSIKNKQDIPYD